MNERTNPFWCMALWLALAFWAQPAIAQDADSAQPPATTAANGEKAPQPDQPPIIVPDQYNSPHATMSTFLRTINQDERSEEDWSTIARCFDLSESEFDVERIQEIAADLFGVMSRLGEVKDRDLDKAAQVKTQHRTSFTYFPNARFNSVVSSVAPTGSIELAITTEGQYKGYWQFTAATVDGIRGLNRSVEKLPQLVGQVSEADISQVHWLRQYIPASLKGKEVFSLEYWQWLAILIGVLLGIVLDQAVRFCLRNIAKRIVNEQKAHASSETITRVVRPIGLVAAALLWIWLAKLLGLPDQAYVVLLTAVRVFWVLAISWAAWRLIDLVGEVLMSKAADTATKFDDVLVPLLRKTLKIFVVVFGLIYGAHSLHIEIMPLLAGLGIGGLAFAFAAKDTVENFFGSVSVILDRPFEIGDWIVIGDVEGTVETLGFRSTRVRTFYNSQVTIPNANLVRANVDNYGRRKYRRWKTHVGVQYDTTPEQLTAFAEGIRELVRCHPYTRKDYFQVWVHQFGPSSIDILIYVFHEVPDWSVELRERERLILDIVRLADQLGVQFAFPTQTVHLFSEEHRPYESKHKIPQSPTDRQAMTEGIKAAQQIVRNQPWQTEKPGPVDYPAGPTKLDDDEDNAIEDRAAGA